LLAALYLLRDRHFVFFSSQGDSYCHLSRPDPFMLKSLAGTASQNKSLLYFDVFASTDEVFANDWLN
jgi:hypothetical protein